MFIELHGAYNSLRYWQKNPAATRGSYTWLRWHDDERENVLPVDGETVDRWKQELQMHAPLSYRSLFPDGK
jgi:hypothetical protein